MFILFAVYRVAKLDAKMSDRKAVIKNADMAEETQQEAIECATSAMEKFNIEKDIAAYIKKVRRTGSMDGVSACLHHWQIQSLFYSWIYFWLNGETRLL